MAARDGLSRTTSRACRPGRDRPIAVGLDKAGALTCRDHQRLKSRCGLHLISGYCVPETGCAVGYREAHGRRMNSRGSFVHGYPNKRSCRADGVWFGLVWLETASRGHRGNHDRLSAGGSRRGIWSARADHWAWTAYRKWSPLDHGQKLQQRSHGGDCDALR